MIKKQAFVNEEILRNLMTKIHQNGNEIIFGDNIESRYTAKDKKIYINTKPSYMDQYAINHLGVNKDDSVLNTAAHEYSHSIDPYMLKKLNDPVLERFHNDPIVQVLDDLKIKGINPNDDLTKYIFMTQLERFANTNAVADNDLVNKVNKKIYLRGTFPAFTTYAGAVLDSYMRKNNINSAHEALKRLERESPIGYNMLTQHIEPSEVLKFNSSFDIASEHPLDVLRQADAKLKQVAPDGDILKNIKRNYYKTPELVEHFIKEINAIKVDNNVNKLIKLIK